jgi:methylated-DNA-[protein]-cysteine S-methyltransferase
MQKVTKYTIFKTKWGYFGLAGNESGLLRTCLPLSKTADVKSRLLDDLQAPRFDKRLLKTVQEQIIAYFEGSRVNFNPEIPIALEGLSNFNRSVLTACRNIKFGEVLTYSALAKKTGRPKAARAVGNALAKNPLLLIIPCHRVIRSDGKIGGFSAPGGMVTKSKLLEHEQQQVQTRCKRD